MRAQLCVPADERRLRLGPRLNTALGCSQIVTVRQAEPRDAENAVAVLRRSITELCVEDHRGDAGTIAKWLANKTPQVLRAWIESGDNFCVVAEADDQVIGVGLIQLR